MVVGRPAIARGLAAARLARPVPTSALRRSLQPVIRRGYASGESHAASSDIPWLAGAIAVTLPGCYFLWPDKAHGDAHHGHGDHDEGSEAHEDKAEEEEASEDSQESSEGKEEASDESKDDSKEDDKADSKADTKNESSEKDTGKDSDKDDKDSAKDDSSDDDATDSDEKSGGDKKDVSGERKRESDSKGASKKRIDSPLQKNLGEGHHSTEDGSPSGKTATTPSGDSGAIDSKQKGISSTPTRHSTAIDKDPEKSKKGEGVPDTAKSQTTVDPKRPAV